MVFLSEGLFERIRIYVYILYFLLIEFDVCIVGDRFSVFYIELWFISVRYIGYKLTGEKVRIYKRYFGSRE